MQANNGWTATSSLDSFDCTLANVREVVFGCLEAAARARLPRSGPSTACSRASCSRGREGTGAERITAIDPAPRAGCPSSPSGAPSWS